MPTSRSRPLARGFPEATAEQWRAAAARAVGAAGLEALVSRTDDGIEVAPLYAPALGNAEADPAPRSGWPLAWEIAQPHRHPDPAEAAREIREDLEGGCGSAVVRLDRAVGRGSPAPDGVLAHDSEALGRLAAGLPAEGAPIRLEAGEWALERLADLEALVERGDAAAARRCRVLADPVSAALEGAPGDPAARLEACLAALADGPMLALAADGRPWHEAGASEAQEIAAALGSALLWLRGAEAAGLPSELALARLELVLAVDDDLFLSIAKLRAARLVLERILDAAGLGERVDRIRIRAETGQRMLSRLDPWVNVLRTTVAALAAVAGGADALTVQPFDRPLGEASALARRIARNIQLVLREEAGAGRVRDPAAGAWYVAHLTRSLAEAAWAGLQAIEAEGGLLGALRAGRLQAEVERVRRARAERLALGRAELVGVSAFPTLDERVPPSPPVDLGPALAAARAALADRVRPVEPAPFRRLRASRAAEPFEALRARAEAARLRTGRPGELVLVGLGRPGELHELASRVENLLAAGGLRALAVPAPEPEPLASALRRSGCRAAIGCLGESAAGRAGELVAALRAAGAERIWLAGAARPWPEGVPAIGPGLDRLAFLGELHDLLGSPGPAAGGSP